MRGPVNELDRILGRFSLAYRVRSVATTLAEEALAIALVAAFAAVVMPSRWVLVALAGIVVLVARAPWLLARTRLDPRAADRRLGLGDRLTTYVSLRDRARSPAMAWLARDLEQRIAGDPRRLGRVAGARRFRPARTAVPVLIALLLLALFFPPLRDGILELPREDAAAAPPDEQVGQAPESERETPPEPSSSDEKEPGAGDPRPEDSPKPPPTGESGSPPPDQPGPQAPPEALLDDLQVRDEITVPQFVGEGEGRTDTARVAALDEGIAAPAPPAPRSAGDVVAPEQELPDPVRFERALERALRARHVPEDERPFVKRWFTSLLEAAK